MKIVAKYEMTVVHLGLSSYFFILAFSPPPPVGDATYGVYVVDVGQTETEILAQMQAMAVETGNARRIAAGLPGDLNITDIRGGTL